MTFGRVANSLRRGLALLLVVGSAAQGAPSWDLAALMQRLARQAHPPVAYSEVQELAMLQIPMTQTGTLRRLPDGTLEKQVLSPRRERFLIGANTLRIEAADGSIHEIPLDSDPRLGALASAFRATLAGDRATLEHDYRLELTGNAAAWRLRLVPSGAALKAVVTDITIEGSAGRIARFITDQADGDHSTLTLHWPTP